MNTTTRRHGGRRRTTGFYTDSRGRTRPITPRITTVRVTIPGIPGHEAERHERHEKEWDIKGHWEDRNGERIWISDNGTSWEKKDIPFLKAHIRMFEDEYKRCSTESCRKEVLKEISDYKRYLKNVLKLSNQSAQKHLYRYGAEKEELKKFEREYGKSKGDYIYGAVVGKVKREREAEGRQ